jgi:hypothetical protein
MLEDLRFLVDSTISYISIYILNKLFAVTCDTVLHNIAEAKFIEFVFILTIIGENFWEQIFGRVPKLLLIKIKYCYIFDMLFENVFEIGGVFF